MRHALEAGDYFPASSISTTEGASPMSLDHARAFLHRVLPWAPLGDPDAYVNIHWTFQREGFDRPAWGGRACKTLDEAIRAIQFAQKSADTRDIYVCMSSQRQMEEVAYKSGNGSWRKAIRSQENAVQLRSLFLDVDVKEGGYPTTQAAIIALSQFLQASGMPKPTLMVASGSGGMHVYWCLSQALSVHDWQPLAFALAEAARRHGFHCDTGVTVDAARVLRVPGTLNHKTNPPRPVTLGVKQVQDFTYPVDDIRAALTPYIGAQVISLVPRGAQAGLNDDLSAGVTREAPPVDLAQVATECGFIREALETGGAAFPQPLWNLSTLIATFAEGGRDLAHKMSAGHPGYTEEATDALFERKTKERALKDLGWPKCASIQNAGCAACGACAHLQAGLSPLNFGVKRQPLLQAGGDVPHGYLRGDDGIVYQLRTLEDGTAERKQICPYPFKEPWLQGNPWTLHFTTQLDRPTPIAVLAETISSRNKLGEHLAKCGMGLTPKQLLSTQEFLMSWLNKLQSVKDAVVTAAPFGWVMDGNKISGFAYGGQVWMPKGESKPAAQADPIVFSHYAPTGDMQPWRDVVAVVQGRNEPALDAILAMAFAAPLVRFTGKEGLLMSVYSAGSGAGKTTAIKAAQAVWGHPIAGVCGLTDTVYSVGRKMGALRHLPMWWDEIKEEEQANKFVSFAFDITRGREKTRLNADLSMRASGEWQTILLASSNDSLLDYVQRKLRTTTAGVYRVFEYVVPVKPPSPGFTSSQVDRMASKLSENFGQAGLIYAKFLGENFAVVEKEVANLHDQVSNKFKVTQEERFWAATVTILIAGARYGNKLGLTNINEKALLQFLLGVFGKMRGEVNSLPADLSSPLALSNVLQQYLGAMRARHTLITDRILITRGKPSQNGVKILSDLSRLDAIYVHRSTEMQIIRISATHFRQWCGDHGYSPTVVVRALTEQFGVKKTMGRLGSGTEVSGMTEYLYEIELAGSKLATLDADGDGDDQDQTDNTAVTQ
jgi:hypothetical protein